MTVLQSIYGAIASRVSGEPVLTLAMLNAVLAVAVGFGLPVSKEQVGLLNALTAAVLGWIARGKVTPT